MGLSKSQTVGVGNPKLCPRCGKQGTCYDTRMVSDYVRRRYRCKEKSCDTRWGTAEFFVSEGDLRGGKVSDFRQRDAKKQVREVLRSLADAWK